MMKLRRASDASALEQAQQRIAELEAECQLLRQGHTHQTFVQGDTNAGSRVVPGSFFSGEAYSLDDFVLRPTNADFLTAFALPEEFSVYDLQHVIKPEDVDRLVENVIRSGRQQTPFRDVMQMRTIEGEWVWMLMEASVERASDGKILFYGSCKCVDTQSDISQNVVAQSTAHYKTLFETTPSIQIIVNPSSLLILDANPAACAYYGYQRTLFRGCKLTRLSLLEETVLHSRLSHALDLRCMQYISKHRVANDVVRDVEILASPVLYQGERVLHFVISDVTEKSKAQEEIVRQKRIMDSMLGYMGQGILVVGKDGEIVSWNQRYLELLGIPPATLKQCKTIYDIINWCFAKRHGAAEQISESIKRAKSKEAFSYEFVTPAKRSIEVCQRPLPDGGMVRTFTDITERKQQERLFTETFTELQAIFDNSQVGVLMMMGNRVIRRINKRMLDILGYDSPDELEGLYASTLHLSEQSCDQFGKEYWNSLSTQRVHDVEYPLKHKDGHGVWCSLSGKALVPEDLSQGVIWVVQDISKRKRAEKALHNSEQRFRSFVENSSDLLFSIGVSGKLHFVSPNVYYQIGYTPAQLLGGTLEKRIHPEDLGGLKKLYGPEQDTAGCIELRLIGVDGKPRWYEFSSSKLWMDAAETIEEEQFVVTGRDIEERKRLEALREDMEHIIRHDLKLPLGAMINVPDLLCRDDNLYDSQRELLKVLEGAGYQMLDLVNSSLDMYKLEHGAYQFAPSKVCIASLTERVKNDLSAIAKNNAQQISVQAPQILLPIGVGHDSLVPEKEVFAVDGESSLLYSMLSNLMKNALEASPSGGNIGVLIHPDVSHVALCITNKGCVPQEVQGRFFDKYVSVGKMGGTGLGTYAARLIAEAHGGHIQLQAEREQTSVTITLPRKISAEEFMQVKELRQ